MNHALHNYQNLIARTDELCRAIAEALGEQITCSEGCSSCCMAISIFPIEAAAIAAYLESLPMEVAGEIRRHAAANDGGERCPLLKEQRCLIYPARPIICRTHGFPIIFTEQAQRRSDCCPLNLKELDHIPGSAIIDLDRLNPLLVAINALYLSQADPVASYPERLTLVQALLLTTNDLMKKRENA